MADKLFTKVQLSNSDKAWFKYGIYPVNGTQTASTNAWTGTIDVPQLYDGLTIAYYLPYAGTSSAATLNLTLANGTTTTGAINVYETGTTRITTHYAAGSTIVLTYWSAGAISVSGTATTEARWLRADYDSNSNTYDRTYHNGAIKAKSAVTAGNLIVGDSGGYWHLKAGTAFDITYPVLYASAKIAANATSTGAYIIIPFTVATTQSITLTAYSAVFIKGTLSGKTFTPVSTAPLTQTIPTSDDGYAYMYIGDAYSTTAIYLMSEHPIYEYKNGAFRPWHGDTSSQTSVNNSGRTYIQDITLDDYGHITGISSATETVTNTDRYVNSAAFADDTSSNSSSPVKMTLTRAGSDTATVTANIPKVSSSSAGVAPKGAAVSSQSQSTKFLREDGSWAAPSYTTNTDTKVTSSANHYAPSTASGQDKTVTASDGTAAWSTDVVKGITLNTDGKGHVTGLSVTSAKIPANPNTNTTYTLSSGTNDGTLKLTPSSGSAQDNIKVTGWDDLKSLATNATHFKGGFAASGDGTIDGGSTTLKSVAEVVGDMYTCTTAGTIYGITFEVGDSIVFKAAVAAGTAPTSASFITVEGETSVSVVDNNPTLAWSTKSKVATIEGTEINVTMPANPNTDTKVTSSTNHYTPATASGQDKTASATGATAAWSIDVVTGVTLNTDGKGHVTGLSVTPGKIPANPNTDSKTSSADTSSKIYLVGATTQSASGQTTYSDNEVYTTSGVLTTKSTQVGGGAATIQYNSTDQCIEFVFA